MAAGPLFKIGDIAYLNESAQLGELEAYRIGAVSQSSPGVWIYQIFIEKRPPDGQTVEDRIDLRQPTELFFSEAELLTLCDAVNIALHNTQGRINRGMQLLSSVCRGSDDIAPVPRGHSRFDVGDTVFVRASAVRGFVESYVITNIHKRPDVAEYEYELDIHGTWPVFSNTLDLSKFRQLFFREPELVNQCEALNMSLDALDRKVARLLAIKVALCTSGSV